MEALKRLIQENQKWLIERAIVHAKRRGYTKSTSKLERSWRLSIMGLSNSIIQALTQQKVLDWSADQVQDNNPVSLFAIRQAKRHRGMGIQLGMFLGLLKCYKESFLDLINEYVDESEFKARCNFLLKSFFDVLEVTLSQEWVNLSENEVLRELRHSNQAIITEKSKYQTIFESLHNPVLVLDNDLIIADQNYRASEILKEFGGDEEGFSYNMKKLSDVLPWLSAEVEKFNEGTEFSVLFEKEISNGVVTRDFSVKLTKLLDAAEDNNGIVMILRDITESKRLERDLRRRLEFEETIKKISSRFIGVHDIEKAINSSLTDLAKACKARQAYLFHFYQIAALSQCKNIRNISLNDYPWWKSKILNKNITMTGEVNRLPQKAKAEKELLESLEIKSFLILPLYINALPFGFIILADLNKAEWNEKEFALLTMVTEIIINALERHQFEVRLKESEESYRTIFENTGTATIITDENKLILLANDEFAKLTGCHRKELEGVKLWTEFFREESLEKMSKYHQLRRRNDTTVPSNYEAKLTDKFENTKNILVHVAMLPGQKNSIISFTDISDKKHAEKKLTYLSYHDALTGLFNRTYFEEEFSNLEQQGRPAGVIICDLDGLKFINDTAGHSAGDAMLITASKVLKSALRNGDILARIGGDEFAILLADCTQKTLEKVCNRIKARIFRHNHNNPKFNLTISLGSSLRSEGTKSLYDVFKEADDNMYREKLHNSQSRQGQILNTLSKAIEVRDFITGGHAERLHEHVTELANIIGLNENDLADLRLFAKFHDIGKIGIPDRILFKTAPLDEDEMSEMRRHCEIGYRIARTSPDLSRIADWILKHHEWWNGKGYPLGIKGKKIPLECRILSIVDAFDAMTSDRPYREAMSHVRAIQELRNYAGIQFDPELTELFIRYISGKLPGNALDVVGG